MERKGGQHPVSIHGVEAEGGVGGGTEDRRRSWGLQTETPLGSPQRTHNQGSVITEARLQVTGEVGSARSLHPMLLSQHLIPQPGEVPKGGEGEKVSIFARCLMMSLTSILSLTVTSNLPPGAAKCHLVTK